MIRFILFSLLSLPLLASTTNEVGKVILIDGAGNTRPANSIATPALVSSAASAADAAKASSEELKTTAQAASVTAQTALNTALAMGTNFVVTSTVYVQSIGGVPYDPSNQKITIHSVAVVGTNVVVVGLCQQAPLSTPKLDWRQALNSGTFSNVAATATQISIPSGVTNVAAAYQFSVAKPVNTSAFFRVVDNSSGASGSGLYWLVFGGVYVDGHKGRTGMITNVVGSVTNTYRVQGGAVVESDPL